MKASVELTLMIVTLTTFVAGVEPGMPQSGTIPPTVEHLLSQTELETESLERRAEKAYRENRFHHALALYSQALRQFPHKSSLYLGRGMTHEMVKRPKKAIEDYTKALEMDPKNYRAMENLAGIHERQGTEIQRAIDLYKRARELDPRPEWQESLAAWIPMLESRQSPESTSNVALWRKGLAAARAGNVSEAEALFTQAITLRPLFYQAYFSRSLIRAERGDLHGALSDLEATAGLSPEFRGVLVQKGLIHERLGHTEEALEAFTLATRADSLDPLAHYHLGRALETDKRYSEAHACYQEALRLKPKGEVKGQIRQRLAALRGAVRSAQRRDSRLRKILKHLW